MAAGIPGAGIGGLFYLGNALLLPLRGLVRRARGESVSWAPLLTQFGLAVGILLAIWLTGWLLGFWLGPSLPMGAAHASGVGVRTARILGAATIFFSLATLAVVLLGVQVARLVLARSR